MYLYIVLQSDLILLTIQHLEWHAVKDYKTGCVCEIRMPPQWPFFENCDLAI